MEFVWSSPTRLINQTSHLKSNPLHFSPNWLSPTRSMLRRNSLSFSWKLIIPPTSPNSSALTHIRSTSSIVTPTASTSDTQSLGFRVADRAVANTTSLSAVDVARHYGRCYWELSKARLRSVVFLLHFLCMYMRVCMYV